MNAITPQFAPATTQALDALIRSAISYKAMALLWQGRIARRQTAPWGEAHCRECEAFWQGELVRALTLIIGGTETDILAHTPATQEAQP
ncbi:MAG: hypothetical protein ING00_17955 [Roseomonas sp.]|nr:hypothetical protein [Roseomonas sp.]